MKELMVHVERIVRPVRAMQVHKLRMRRELLAHLQSAFDEERAGGADETAAVEAAKRRLGDAAVLTQLLQRSVPWIERTLMARVPGVPAIDRLESYSEGAFGLDRNATLLHSAIIVMGAMFLAYMALLIAVLALSPRQLLAAMFARPAAVVVAMNLVNIAAIMILATVSTRFMFDVSRSRQVRAQWPRVACIVLMPAVTTGITIALAFQRAPTAAEVARCGIVGVALLLTTLSIAQIVARLRRPYDPWVTLDLAE